MCFNVVHVCVMFLLFVVCSFPIFLHRNPHGAEHAYFKSAAPILLVLPVACVCVCAGKGVGGKGMML